MPKPVSAAVVSTDALRTVQGNMDQFAMQVGLTLKDIVRRMEKLEERLAALGASAGLSWQSGWAPMHPSNGDKSNGKAPKAAPWAFAKEDDGATKLDPGLGPGGGRLYI